MWDSNGGVVDVFGDCSQVWSLGRGVDVFWDGCDSWSSEFGIFGLELDVMGWE